MSKMFHFYPLPVLKSGAIEFTRDFQQWGVIEHLAQKGPTLLFFCFNYPLGLNLRVRPFWFFLYIPHIHSPSANAHKSPPPSTLNTLVFWGVVFKVGMVNWRPSQGTSFCTLMFYDSTVFLLPYFSHCTKVLMYSIWFVSVRWGCLKWYLQIRTPGM